MASQIVTGKLSFVTKIADLMKATSDDDKPIPGYLYKDICHITYSSGENCETCVGFLAERLAHESTHVKLKALKMMKYIVENGHPNFRLGLLKKSTGIQEATIVEHSGPPDPLHGDVPYKMVRNTAKSVLETLFTMESASQAQSSTPQSRPSINTTGIGSISSNPGIPGKMEGFGNTPNSQPERSVGETIKDSFLKMAEMLGSTSEIEQREVLAKLEGNTGYIPLGYAAMAMPASDSGTDNIVRKKEVAPPKHIPGKAGGGWDDSDDDDDVDDTNDVASDRDQSQSVDSGSCGTGDQRVEGEVGLDYTAEQTVLSNYVDSVEQGISPLLKRNQLKDFLKECAGLNCDKVVEMLNLRLCSTSSEDSTVMRCLMLLEVLVHSDLTNLERLTCKCNDGLVAVYSSRSGQPKSKARKLVRILEKLTSQKEILPLPSNPEVLVNET